MDKKKKNLSRKIKKNAKVSICQENSEFMEPKESQCGQNTKSFKYMESDETSKVGGSKIK